MADHADFPNIYIDSSVSAGGVGSEADPYSSFSEINWTGGGDNSVTDYYAGSPSASVTINLQKGEVWRETFDFGEPGTATYPITLQSYGTGDLPEISGAVLITGWTLSGTSNIWKATASDEMRQVWMDGTFGDRKDVDNSLGGGAESLTNEFDWFWDETGTDYDEEANTLYVYAATDPDTRYTSPGVEAESVVRLVRTQNHDYVTIDGIKVTKAYTAGIYVNESNHVVVKNCTVEWVWAVGVSIWVNNATIEDNIVEDNVIRYCGSQGFLAAVTMAGSGSFSDIVVRRNEVYECGRHQFNATDEWETNQTFTGGIKFWGDFRVFSGLQVYENRSYNHGPDGVIINSGQKGNAIWMDELNGASGDPILIYHNLCYGCSAAGVFLENSSWNDVFYNVMYDNAQGSNSLSAYCGGNIKLLARVVQDTSNNNIFGNTIYGGFLGIQITSYGQFTGLTLSDNTFKNNIVVGCDHILRATEGGANTGLWGSGNVYDNNCFGEEFTDFIIWDSTQHDTYDAWEADHGEVWGQIEEDPSFTDEVGDNYTLASGSACIGTGEVLSSPYNIALMPSSAWPGSVVTGDQDDY